MCTDKAYINKTYRELHYCHQTVLITFYIKDKSLVPDIINTIECVFDI